MYCPSDKPIKQSPPHSVVENTKQNNINFFKFLNIKKILGKYIKNKFINTYDNSDDDFEIIQMEDAISKK